MAEPLIRQRVRAAIAEWLEAQGGDRAGITDVDVTDLAERIVGSLAVSHEHPKPWRPGGTLVPGSTYYGWITVYDGTPDGDAGRPGRAIGWMVASAAVEAVSAVNLLDELLAELPRALHVTPLGEVMGRDVVDAEVPVIAEELRRVAREGGRDVR